MRQLPLFDPEMTPTVTAEMLADRGLRSAIRTMRDGDDAPWPYVERIGAIGDVCAWAVDDHGTRYVVLDHTIFGAGDLWFAIPKIRKAAHAAFARLDAGVSV